MAYGLTIKDASGVIIMSPEDRITRLVYHATVAAGSSGSVNLPIISNRNTLQFALSTSSTYKNINGYIPSEVGHKVVRSGTTISWSPLPKITNVTYVPSDIIVFLYT